MQHMRQAHTSVADQDPGPGAFLTPGSGIQFGSHCMDAHIYIQ
jgi:hypothetical protein